MPQNIDHFESQLRKIKLLALDIDGVQTDASVFWLKDQGWTRQFSVMDGQGMILLKKTGVIIAFISAGDSEDVRQRAERLEIEDAYFGTKDKLKALEEILNKYKMSFEEVAYIGDDVPDLAVLKKVGFGATVPNAVDEVKNVAHYVTQRQGGSGAVREVTDAIMRIQSKGK